jgi:Protein of unknown function (DUF3551)
MRRTLLALMAVCAASAATPAAARDYAYCIKGCNYGAGVGDCVFTSYEQCQATASGLFGTCAANPNYSAKAEMPAGRSRQSQRRL